MSRFGEWWIEEDGDTIFADGDVGDSNHSGIAWDRAMRLMMDALGGDTDVEWITEGALREQYEDWLIENHDMTPEQAEDTSTDFLKAHVKELGIEEHLINAAFDLPLRDHDIREYALRHWGWHWFKDGQIGTFKITEEALKVISDGIYDIMDQQSDPDDESVRSTEVWIWTMVDNRSRVITIGDLLDRNYDGLQIDPAPPAARPAQITAAERAIAEPYYQGKEGD